MPVENFSYEEEPAATEQRVVQIPGQEQLFSLEPVETESVPQFTRIDEIRQNPELVKRLTDEASSKVAQEEQERLARVVQELSNPDFHTTLKDVMNQAAQDAIDQTRRRHGKR